MNNNKKINMMKLLLVIILFLIIITPLKAETLGVVDKEKENTEKQEAKLNAAIISVNALNSLFQDIDTTNKDTVGSYLSQAVQGLHELDIPYLVVNYKDPKLKPLLDADKATRDLIKQKAEAAGLNISDSELIIREYVVDDDGNIEVDDDKNPKTKEVNYDLKWLYEEDGYIIQESFIMKKIVSETWDKKVVRYPTYGIGSLGIIALIFFIFVSRKKWYNHSKAWLKRRLHWRGDWANRLKIAMKHKFFLTVWWKKWNKTYKRYHAFFERVNHLIEKKESLIAKNEENTRKMREVADKDLAELYRKEFKQFSDGWIGGVWARGILTHLEHINKDLMNEMKELVNFTKQGLPEAENALLEGIEEEARNIKKLRSDFLEGETNFLGKKQYKTYLRHRQTFIETRKTTDDVLASGRNAPHPDGENMRTRHDEHHRNIYDEQGSIIKSEMDKIVDLTEHERAKLQQVIDPMMKNLLEFVGKLYNAIRVEEKCIEIEVKQLEALSTKKINPEDLPQFRDIIIHQTKKKRDFYEQEKTLIKENFNEEKELEALEKWLETIEKIKKGKTSYIMEQVNKRVDIGDTYTSVKSLEETLKIPGSDPPLIIPRPDTPIIDLISLHEALDQDKLDIPLRDRLIRFNQQVVKGRRRNQNGQVEEIVETETREQNLPDDLIVIIADWIEQRLKKPELAKQIREQIVPIPEREWERRKKMLINILKQRYPTHIK